MKTRTKITVTLAVGIGLLIGSMGVASASPHYSDFKGGTSFKAPVSSYTEVEWTLKAPVDSGRTSGFRGCIPTDPCSSYTEVEWTLKAPVSSYTEVEWTLKASVRGNNRGEWVVEAPVSSYREDGAGRLHEIQRNLETNVWNNGNATSLEHGPGFRGCLPTDPDHKDWLNGCIQAPVEPSAFVKLGDIQAPVEPSAFVKLGDIQAPVEPSAFVKLGDIQAPVEVVISPRLF
jgi:hypothetical protein